MQEDYLKHGFVVRDNFLPEDVFNELALRAQSSWKSRQGWRLRLKGAAKPISLPLQEAAALEDIRNLIDKKKAADPTCFTYMFHSLQEVDDDHGLVAAMSIGVIQGWEDLISEIGLSWSETNFSITAFSKLCFLDSHTDHQDINNPYQLTLLLYLSSEVESRDKALCFDFNGIVSTIEARPNRSVAFVPSSSSNHWIERSLSRDSSLFAPRLALSGWLI